MRIYLIVLISSILLTHSVYALESIMNSNFNTSQQNVVITEESMTSSGNIIIDRGNRDFKFTTQKFHIFSPIFNIIDKLSASNNAIVTMNSAGFELKNNINSQLFKIITDNDNLKFNSNVNIQVKGTDLKYDGAKIEAGKVFFENNAITFHGINLTSGSVDFNFETLTLNSLPINVTGENLFLNNLYGSNKIISLKNDDSNPILSTSDDNNSAATNTWWTNRHYIKPGTGSIQPNEPILTKAVTESLTWDVVQNFGTRYDLYNSSDFITKYGTKNVYMPINTHSHHAEVLVVENSDNQTINLICPSGYKAIYGIGNRETFDCKLSGIQNDPNQGDYMAFNTISSTGSSYQDKCFDGSDATDRKFYFYDDPLPFQIVPDHADGSSTSGASGWLICAGSSEFGEEITQTP